MKRIVTAKIAGNAPLTQYVFKLLLCLPGLRLPGLGVDLPLLRLLAHPHLGHFPRRVV